MRPPPMRRDTSLFDSLEDEADYEEAETTIAVVEMDDDYREEQTVATTGSRWRLRLPKVRSIPKLRSFRRGKKGKKKKKHNDPEDHIGELPARWMHADQ
jgi:TorA maturation chaperone TorD